MKGGEERKGVWEGGVLGVEEGVKSKRGWVWEEVVVVGGHGGGPVACPPGVGQVRLLEGETLDEAPGLRIGVPGSNRK